MTTGSRVGVRTGELGKFGNKLRMSGQEVAGSAESVTDNMFGSGDAGPRYTIQGANIQSGLELVAKWLGDWGSAAEALGDAVGASVVAYGSSDDGSAVQIAQQTQKL